LNDGIEVSPMVTAVHCTHTAAADMEQWLALGGNVCLCPLTEANLADGVSDMHRIVKQGGCVSLHAPYSKARWLCFFGIGF